MILVHAHRHLLWRYASLVLGCWKHARFSLGTLHHLAAHILPGWRRARRDASGCHLPWIVDDALGQRWWRSPMSHVSHCRQLQRK